MKLHRWFLSFAALALVILLALPALAQVGGTQPPPLTPGVATALALALIIGVLQGMIQSGTFLGIAVTPPVWLPYLTVAFTFVTGVAGFVTSLGGSFVFSVTDVVYAIAAGIGGLVSGSAGALVPALAQHAHVTLPAVRFAARLAKRAGKTAGVLLFVAGLGHATAGCKQAVAPTIELGACVAGVVNIDVGLPLLQIVADSIAQCGTDLVAILDALAQQLSLASSDGGPAYTLTDIRAARAAYLADPNTFMTKLPQARKVSK